MESVPLLLRGLWVKKQAFSYIFVNPFHSLTMNLKKSTDIENSIYHLRNPCESNFPGKYRSPARFSYYRNGLFTLKAASMDTTVKLRRAVATTDVKVATFGSL